MPRRNSVLTTQKPVLDLEREIHEMEQGLVEMKARLEQLTAAHKAQIQRSLSAADPEERRMAAGVAVFWGVLPAPMDSKDAERDSMPSTVVRGRDDGHPPCFP
jgi:hypothetical protein